MVSRPDPMRERIAAYHFPRGGVEVVRAKRGYTLYSRRIGGPVARLRPTGDGDCVQVLWWRREAWGTDSEGRRPVIPGSPALLVQAKQCKSRDAVEKERSFGLACHLLPVHGRGGA